MANPFLDALEGVVTVLDTPGSVSRGLLAGQPGRAIGGIFDSKRRVHGREMLEQWGLVDPKESDGFDLGDAAGIAASIATDPLTFIPLGIGAKLAKGGKFKSPVSQAAAAADVPTASLAPAIPVASLAPAAAPVVPAVAAASEAAEAAIPVAKKIVPTFYSRLEESIGQLPESINSQSVINRLKKGGVTDEEIEATNIARVLQGKNKVSRQELLDHFAENKVVVNEVVKGSSTMPEKDIARYLELDNKRFSGSLTPDEEKEFLRLEKIKEETTVTRYADYQTPGGSNYRELVLTVPEKLPEGFEIRMVDNPNGRKGRSFEVFKDGTSTGGRFPTEQQAKYFVGVNYSGSYTHAHWPDEVNPIAHVRFNDRVGPNGEKILHIEEIQSDIHQAAGGKAGKGYLTKAKRQEYDELAKANEALRNEIRAIDETYGTLDSTEALYDKKLRIAGQMDEIGEMLPDLPFKKNWHELTMKRMIRYAAENGYDRITLSPGEQVHKLVGGKLEGQQAFYNKAMPEWMKKYGKQFGVEVEPYQIVGKRTVEDSKFLDSATRKVEFYSKKLERANDLNQIAEAEYWQSMVDENLKLIDDFHKRHPEVIASSMPLNPQLRKDVLTRGQPLMQFAAPIGGSALLAALMAQERT